MNRQSTHSLIKLLSITILGLTGIMGCGQATEKTGEDLKVTMITDSGSIDDKSFNQGT